MKTYSRLWCGQKLVANVISINEEKVVYYFNNPKEIIMEYTPLFLSKFTAE